MEPTLSLSSWSMFIDLFSPKIRDCTKQNKELQKVKNYFHLKKCKQFQLIPTSFSWNLGLKVPRHK